MEKFEKIFPLVDPHQRRGVAVKAGVRLFKRREQFLSVKLVEKFEKNGRGALRVIHAEHGLHFSVGKFREGFGDEQSAVRSDPFDDCLCAGNRFSSARAHEFHSFLLVKPYSDFSVSENIPYKKGCLSHSFLLRKVKDTS